MKESLRISSAHCCPMNRATITRRTSLLHCQSGNLHSCIYIKAITEIEEFSVARMTSVAMMLMILQRNAKLQHTTVAWWRQEAFVHLNSIHRGCRGAQLLYIDGQPERFVCKSNLHLCRVLYLFSFCFWYSIQFNYFRKEQSTASERMPQKINKIKE